MALHAAFRYSAPFRRCVPCGFASFGVRLLPVPLFDITSIDRAAVCISSDEVATINPHRGDMRHLDHVIWMSDGGDCALGVKHVRDNEFWVPGHIPGRPLFPGVLMIEAAAQLASVQYKSRSNETRFLGFARCDDVSFRGQVVPGDTLYLLSKEIDFRVRRFVCQCQGIVNDKIAFEVKITGMAI